MSLVAGRYLKRCGFHLDEVPGGEPVADRSRYRVTLKQARATVGMAVGRPPGRGVGHLASVLDRSVAVPLTPYPLPVPLDKLGTGEWRRRKRQGWRRPER